MTLRPTIRIPGHSARYHRGEETQALATRGGSEHLFGTTFPKMREGAHAPSLKTIQGSVRARSVLSAYAPSKKTVRDNEATTQLPQIDQRETQALAKRAARGFTLLEVGIAIALLAGLTALASTSISSLSSADLRKSIGQLQGLTRDTYMRTALVGQPHRLVMDLDANSFWIEKAEGRAVIGAEKIEADRDGKVVFDKVDERIEDLDIGDDEPEDMVKKDLYGGPQWGAVDDEFGKPTMLPSGVQFDQVWVDHLRTSVTGGKVAMIFFVGGYMQEAQITLREGSDEDTDPYTLSLVTAPLTGETYIEREIPQVPQ